MAVENELHLQHITQVHFDIMLILHCVLLKIPNLLILKCTHIYRYKIY